MTAVKPKLSQSLPPPLKPHVEQYKNAPLQAVPLGLPAHPITRPKQYYIVPDPKKGGLEFSDKDSTGSGYTFNTGSGGLQGSVISKEEYVQPTVKSYGDLPGLVMVNESYQDNWPWYMMSNENFKQMVGTGSGKIEFKIIFKDFGPDQGIKLKKVDKGKTLSLIKGHEYDFIVIKAQPEFIRFLDRTAAIESGVELAGHSTMLAEGEWDICYKNFGEPSKQTKYVLYAGRFIVSKDHLKIISWSNDSGHFIPWRKNALVFAAKWGLNAATIEFVPKGAHQQIYDMLKRIEYVAAKREAFENQLAYDYYDDIGYIDGYGGYDDDQSLDYQTYQHGENSFESQKGIESFDGHNYGYSEYDKYRQKHGFEMHQILYIGIALIIFATLCCIYGVVFVAVGSFIFGSRSSSTTKYEIYHADAGDNETQCV